MVNTEKLATLSKGGKEELALALYLWKVFKTQNEMDFELSAVLDVEKEFLFLVGNMPLIEIKKKD